PQAERAMLAMTRRLSKANILRIFLLLAKFGNFGLKNLHCLTVWTFTVTYLQQSPPLPGKII
ncbi:MAG TPA: hypothetical protein PKE48_06740, partial [Anaerolineales bacterium]|nr:hypothetical protein [Anaerolineales bacterium]